jgi:hypothetical protein
VGYIKGYHQASEVNYYVFGADESGHRYQQPVFGELDPHHFTVNISILRGDVNNDGKVDVTDVNIVVNIILGKDNAANYDGRADVNGVDGVDVSDVNAIVNIILGKGTGK